MMITGMEMKTIKVEAKVGYHPVKDASDLDMEPAFFIINIKREGKDGFESTVKIPIGEVSPKEFAKAAKVLQLVAHSFYHQQYRNLRENQ